MKKKLKYMLMGMLLWFLLHETIIIFDGLNDEIEKADLAVIFGNTGNEDGSS